MRRAVLSILGLTALAACAGERPTSPPDNHLCNLRNFEVPDTARSLDEYASRVDASAVDRNKPVTVNMLHLSAGGEFGSYGAGFLQG